MKAKANSPVPATNGVVAHASHHELAAPPNGVHASAVKLSVNVSREIGMRLRRIAFDERISESSIVEIALDGLFDGRSDSQLGALLRDKGASLRRPGRE